MAHLIPEQLPPGVPDSERRVARALAGLPNSWHILHSVSWQGLVDQRRCDGEADFVIVNAEHGIIVLEVKGGGITIRRGRWHSTDRHGEEHAISNPFLQATSSKHALLRYLKAREPALPFLPAAHAVVFPDLEHPGSLGPAAPEGLALGRSALRRPAPALQRLLPSLRAGERLTSGHVARIVELLAPTLEVRPLLRNAVEDVSEALVQLTGEQMRVLDQLRRNQRAVIYGGAGTGKTILAAEKARRLAAEGFRVLLTCFNRPLGEHLAAVTADTRDVVAMSFHAFTGSEARRAQIRFPAAEDPYWDDTVAETLSAAAERNQTKMDAVVIDEAQDFSVAWFTALQLLLRDPDRGPMYLFADAQQAIYRPDWVPPFREPAFDLTVNCRNTREIAARVAGVFGATVETLGVTGPEPEHYTAETTAETYEVIRKALHRLTHDGELRPDQVVVLSPRKAHVEDLCGRTIAGLELAGLGQGHGTVTVETVHRFKGLESDAVILVVPEFTSAQDRALAYIGLSRARSVLVVISPDDVWAALTRSAVSRN